MLFLTGGYFPVLVRKLRCTATIDCVRAHSGTQKPSVLPSPSSLTQTAPLTAADEISRPRQVQINLESFSSYMWVVDVDVLRTIQVYRFCEMCPGIMNNPELC